MWGGGILYSPIVIKAKHNDSSINTIRSINGSTVDVAFDLADILDSSQNESISSIEWTTDSTLLPVVATGVNGVLSMVRLTNSLPIGSRATAYCSMGTSIGRKIIRSLIIVSD